MTRYALLLLLVCASCKTSYEGRFRYAPTPHEVLIQPEDADVPVARLMVSMQGVRDPDRDGTRPLAMDVRLRIENESEAEVVLDLEALLLLDASLEAFGEPIVPPDAGEPVAPGTTHSLELLFPFPDGLTPRDMDLSGLHLSVVLHYGGGEARVSTIFERREPQVVYIDRWHGGLHVHYLH